jgi:sortase (surface protein transpeptidase)
MPRCARWRLVPIALGVLLLLALNDGLVPHDARAALVSRSPAAAQPGATAATTDALNLRTAPSISAPVQLVMPAGAVVSVTGGPFNSVWYGVTYNGSTGFAHGSYLTPALPVPTAQPVRLVIPAIGLDQRTVPAGLDAQGIGIVPKHDIGWYSLSALPGQNSNVVFWGHVLRWRDEPTIPAPFAHVKELGVGAALQVVTSDGQVHRYTVTQQLWVQPSDASYIQPTTAERVTLVSCIGENVIRDGEFTKAFRLITIAEPVR